MASTKLKPIKLKKCSICKGEYKPFSSTARVCSPTCAIEFNRQKDIKTEKKKASKAKKEHALRKKIFQVNDVKKQLALTQTVFNKLRRLQEFEWFKSRGLEPECISCGKKNMDWCNGHFKTVGSQGALRFDPMNSYLQCNRYCNKALSGNIEGNKSTRGYKVGLVVRFGENEAGDIISYCEVDRVKKWTGPELFEMRKEFNKQIKSIEGDK